MKFETQHIVFATGNKGKIKEVQKIFNDSKFEILSLYDLGEVPEIREDGNTFYANAKIKAEAVYAIHKMQVIADDSGLEVEQLDNAPGIYSARYAGENCTYEDNNRKLLNELDKFSEPHLAQFVCAAVFYDGNNYISAEGVLKGRIINEIIGDKGFGYDPVFIPEGYTSTLAQLDLDEKNSISHRGQAFLKLKKLLLQKEDL
jgi:XTP/dITP diphosphohydrolase